MKNLSILFLHCIKNNPESWGEDFFNKINEEGSSKR
jgi:hypothetical protein